MNEEETRFARRMIEPILAAFKRDVAQQRANGATDTDIETMLERIAIVNRPFMYADQLNYFMDLYREAAGFLTFQTCIPQGD